jgi:hypothetical protein
MNGHLMQQLQKWQPVMDYRSGCLLPLEQELEMALKASRCVVPPPTSDDDRHVLTAIKAEMAVFASSGQRGRLLQKAWNYLMTIPATSVEAERAFSAAGLICGKLRSSLRDDTVDTLAFLKAYYRETILPVS